MSTKPSPAPDTRKGYEKPTMRKLTPEQAKMLFLGEAKVGNDGASEMLELLYPDVSVQGKTP